GQKHTSFPLTYTRASLIAPSNFSTTRFDDRSKDVTSNVVLYHPTPTYGNPPVRPVFTVAIFSPFCVTATSCKSCARSNGPRSEEHTSELQSRENLVC